jgi:O-antigen/teichoic acid export membrane protein
VTDAPPPERGRDQEPGGSVPGEGAHDAAVPQPAEVQPTAAGVDRARLQDGAVRGATWTVLHTLVSLPVAFVVNLIVARILGVSDYGRLAFLTSLMEVASGIISLGFGSALIQFGSRFHASGHHDELRHLLSAAQGFRLLVAAPLLTAVIVLVVDVPPPMLALAVVFGILVPTALDGAAACVWIENKSAAGAKIALVTSLTSSAAVVVAAVLARTPDAVWATRLVVTGAAVALSLVPISPAYRRAVLRPRLPRGLPAGFWRFAIPAAAAGVVGGLVMSRSEIFFMTWLATPAAVGAFALAYGLAGHLFAPAQAFVGPLIPAISGLRAVDSDALGPAFRRTLRAGSTVVGLLVAAAVSPLALLVTTLYGIEYASAAPVVVVLGISAGLVIVFSPVTAFVTSRLSAGELLRANLVALVVDALLAVTLIPVAGIWGAVVANVGAATIRFSLLVRTEIALLGMRWVEVWTQVRPAVLGAVLCLALWFAARPFGFGIVPAVVAGLVGLAGYVAALRVARTGLTEADAGSIARPFGSRLRPVLRVVLPMLTRSRLGA